MMNISNLMNAQRDAEGFRRTCDVPLPAAQFIDVNQDQNSAGPDVLFLFPACATGYYR